MRFSNALAFDSCGTVGCTTVSTLRFIARHRPGCRQQEEDRIAAKARIENLETQLKEILARVSTLEKGNEKEMKREREDDESPASKRVKGG